jgi:hypothetical protein
LNPIISTPLPPPLQLPLPSYLPTTTKPTISISKNTTTSHILNSKNIMSQPQTQDFSPTLRQKLANNAFTLPIILVFLLIAFDNWISSYDLAFPMRVWLWTTNVGVGMVVVGMCGARIAKGAEEMKEA